MTTEIVAGIFSHNVKKKPEILSHSGETTDEEESDTDDADQTFTAQLFEDLPDLEEDNENEEDEDDNEGEDTDEYINEGNFVIIYFVPNLGPVPQLFDQCKTPGDYFLNFFDQEIRKNIVYQTNLYSNQKGKRFSPLNEKDLFGFIGINFIMGYHKLPSWTNYWKLDRDLSVPVAETLPRNRFASILSNLHVNDNTAIPAGNKDKLYKLRPLISSLNENYAKLYNVSQKVSIDESMILFKGRSSLKQYNPKKPIKRGYKLWMRADMDAYISKFDIYQGKNVSLDVEGAPAEFGLGEKVIFSLTKDLRNKNHQVDKLFLPVELSVEKCACTDEHDEMCSGRNSQGDGQADIVVQSIYDPNVASIYDPNVASF
eukprot:gene12537-13823_t